MFNRLVAVGISAAALACSSNSNEPETPTLLGGASSGKGGASTSSSGQATTKGGTSAAHEGGAVNANGGAKQGNGGAAAVQNGGASASKGGANSSGTSAAVAGGQLNVNAGGGGKITGVAGKAGQGNTSMGGAVLGIGGRGLGTSGQGSAGSAQGNAGRGNGGQGNSGAANGGAPSAGAAGTTFVENENIDRCPVPTLPTSYSNAKLPDPFTRIDGTRIVAKSDWPCRRQEIVKLAEATAYGTKPPRPESVTGTITESKITVNVSQAGKSASFSGDIVKPSKGSKPYPAIVGFIMPTLGTGLDTSILSNAGVALINIDVTKIGGEPGASRARTGAFFTVNPNSTSTGILMAWAWGLSRIIDLVQQSDGTILKADAIGVAGCSRLGKGAFVAGAFDQRVALALPMESGTGGAPIWRGVGGEGAQSLSSAYTEQPWLGDAFQKNTGSASGYLIDTHEVVALYAPRGLLILDNPHIANLGPKSAHVAALAGAEVYKALGYADRLSYRSDTAEGRHCVARSEYVQPVKDAIERYLLKTGTAAGTFKASSGATGKLADFSDWIAPTLQ